MIPGLNILIKGLKLEREIELKIPKGIQSGKKIRLNNKGVVSIGRNNRRGSHIITIIVSIPSELSSDQKDLFEKLKKSFSSDKIPVLLTPKKNSIIPIIKFISFTIGLDEIILTLIFVDQFELSDIFTSFEK